ncbi:MAG TPA: hypothetical protein VFV08_14345, partial [Puia sp.]|nr:hypothetical protein [Puia sp.]
YLDTDDKLFHDHLGMIASEFGDKDWVYFNDYLAMDAALTMRERKTEVKFGSIGTSCIAHRSHLAIQWDDGYSHDWQFVQKLYNRYTNAMKIRATGYLVCHLPGEGCADF